MSPALYAEKHRPQFHFTAQKNWLNDPNGCVYCAGEIDLRLLVDRTSIELFLERGLVCMSSCFLPAGDDAPIRCVAEGGPVRVRSLTIHALRSAWA